MSQKTNPQGNKPDGKQPTPWRVQFTCKKTQPDYLETRKDLLTACWGNEKMAHVLYHFLCSGSWKAHNTHLDENVRVVSIQESHAYIIKKLSELKFKVKLSEPTLITYIKMFAQAGYIRKVARKEAFEINFESIEKAFTNAPDKPVLGKNLSSNLSLNNESQNEIEMLRQEIKELREQMHDLSLTLVQFKFAHAQDEHEFKLNLSSRTKDFKLKNSDEDAQEDDAETLFDPKNNLLDKDNLEEKKERKESADAPPSFLPIISQVSAFHAGKTPQFTNLDLTSLSGEPSDDLSYSQENTQQPSFEQNQEKTGELPDAGYKQAIDVNTSSEQKGKQTSTNAQKNSKRDKKEKVVQSTLQLPPISPEGMAVFGWYCKQPFFPAKTPELNDTRIKHSETLVSHVHSQEDMNSLVDFAKKKVEARIKKTIFIVEMGNLTNDSILNEWLAAHKQLPAQKPTSGVIHLDEERIKRDEEKNQRNLEANRQATIAKLQEKMANGRKLQNFEVVMAAERFGMTLPPQYMEQYLASKQQVAVGQ